jgi:predicted DNA-binding transcriptional regulator YafY
MSRTQRLLDLLQRLRLHRRPVSGAALADELGISLRTLYRDIAALQAQGAKIDGAAGLGYLLMFSEEEIEALVLGMRWVGERGDAGLGEAARNALAKVESVLPNELRLIVDSSTLLIGPGEQVGGSDAELALIRQAIRDEHKLDIHYRDRDATDSQRTIWPFALAFFDCARVVVAWCELRQAFRHFRTDRISALTPSNIRYPQRRHALLKAWREVEGVPE